MSLLWMADGRSEMWHIGHPHRTVGLLNTWLIDYIRERCAEIVHVSLRRTVRLVITWSIEYIRERSAELLLDSLMTP